VDKYFRAEFTAIDPRATIGDGTMIWEFSKVREFATIGEKCSIGQGCYVDVGVQIGNRTRIGNNVSVFKHVDLEEDVFIAPNVVFTNDKYPPHAVWARTLVKKGAAIGAGAVIIAGVTIGENSLIGAGAVIMKDVPSNTVIYSKVDNVIKDYHRESKCG